MENLAEKPAPVSPALNEGDQNLFKLYAQVEEKMDELEALPTRQKNMVQKKILLLLNGIAEHAASRDLADLAALKSQEPAALAEFGSVWVAYVDHQRRHFYNDSYHRQHTILDVIPKGLQRQCFVAHNNLVALRVEIARLRHKIEW